MYFSVINFKKGSGELSHTIPYLLRIQHIPISSIRNMYALFTNLKTKLHNRRNNEKDLLLLLVLKFVT